MKTNSSWPTKGQCQLESPVFIYVPGTYKDLGRLEGIICVLLCRIKSNNILNLTSNPK